MSWNVQAEYITGWTENPIEAMKLFDQAVLLSRWEGFGLVLAEYMTLEKPIVATAVDAIPDLITDYENGLLVEPDSPEKSAAAICEIYENKELKYKLINNGKMRVNAFFDISRVANEHERLIVKIYGRERVIPNLLFFTSMPLKEERREAA